MTGRTWRRCCWHWKLWGMRRRRGGIASCLRRRRRKKSAGRGALWLLRLRPAMVGIALEIGPRVPESLFPLDDQPTVWVNDSYSAMQAADIEPGGAGGGGYRSNAALSGPFRAAEAMPVARPHTAWWPGPSRWRSRAENSHGYEIMHRNAVPNLAALLTATLREVLAE